MNMKKFAGKVIFIFLLATVLAAAAWAGPKPAAPTTSKMSTPILSCGTVSPTWINILVCAGTTGAPAGFSLHWLKLADFTGVWPDSETMCHGSFSGNANNSAYNLGANQCTSVQVGDNLFDDPGASSNCADLPLECGTDYVFRGFAHANSTFKRSDFTGNLVCRTADCVVVGGCTLTQGYWKTHNDTVCLLNPASPLCVAWPAASLTLGNVSYTQAELLAIFGTTPAGGNGLVSLAHQLIAAKLNVANGADDSSVASTIAAADALIGNLVVPSVGSGFLSAGSTSALTNALDSYNTGLTGPGHCDD